MIKETELSQSELIERLSYNAEDGTFTWTDSNKNNLGFRNKPAGSSIGTAITIITIAGERWADRQLAWYWMTGVVPQGRVKAKDGDLSNCRFENLEYTPSKKGGERYIHCGREGLFFVRKGRVYYGSAKTLEGAVNIRDSFPELL